LAQRGIEIESTAHLAVPGAEPGQVVGQNPPANSTDVAAPKVSLLVADQPSPQAFVMPSFIGQPLGTVTNSLRDAGFALGKVTVAEANSVPLANPTPEPPAQAIAPPPSTPSPASIIVAQEPAPGNKILAGSAINFVVK